MGGFQAIFNAQSGLRAAQSALDTIGHNISNASTPGYSRQVVRLGSSSGIDRGFGFVGTGTSVLNVERQADEFLEERLRDSLGQQMYLDEIAATYAKVELHFNELTETDLSSSLNEFWSSLHELESKAEDSGSRIAVINESRTLMASMNQLIRNLDGIADDLESDIQASVDTINTLTTQIADLNTKIMTLEAGGTRIQEANDLRDFRDQKAQELYKLTGGNGIVDASGSLNITIRGHYAVFRGKDFPVTTDDSGEDGKLVPVFEDGGVFDVSDGQIGGLVYGRDSVVGEFQDSINELAASLIWEFNKVHSTGRGLEGYSSIVGEQQIDDSTAPLDEAGLIFDPVLSDWKVSNGSFDLMVRTESGAVADEVIPIAVDLDNRSTLTPSTLLSGVQNLAGFPQTIDITDTDGNLYSVSVDSSYNNIQDVINAINKVASAAPDTAGRLEAFIDNSGGQNILVVRDKVAGAGNLIVDDNFGLFNAGPGPVAGVGQGFNGRDLTTDLPIENDMSLDQLAAIINSVDHITASVTAQRKLEITSDDGYTFSFANDTSSVLAYLGVGTYFSGYNANTIGLNETVSENANYFAAGRLSKRPEENAPGVEDFAASDNKNLQDLLNLRSLSFMTGDMSLEQFHEATVSSLALGTARAEDQLSAQVLKVQNLEFERDQISGVSLDEEATQMIMFQRSYQAAARMISTMDEIFQTLIGM